MSQVSCGLEVRMNVYFPLLFLANSEKKCTFSIFKYTYPIQTINVTVICSLNNNIAHCNINKATQMFGVDWNKLFLDFQCQCLNMFPTLSTSPCLRLLCWQEIVFCYQRIVNALKIVHSFTGTPYYSRAVSSLYIGNVSSSS